MAITVVNTPAAFNTSTGGASQTYAFQCNSGTDFLVVGVASYADHDTGGVSRMTSQTYNGVAMTVAAHYGLGAEDVHILVLKAPPTGSSFNCVMNYSPNNSFGLIAQALCLSGVDQTTPTGNINGAGDSTGIASPVSHSITMTAGSWAFDVAATSSSGTLAVQGSQVEVSNNTWGGQKMGFSRLLDATSMGWTYTGALSRFSHGVLEIKVASGAAAATPNQNDAVALVEVITPNLINMPKVFN